MSDPHKTDWAAGAVVEETAYRRSLLEEVADLVAELRATLGASAVADVAGVKESRAVHQWASGERAIRSPDVEARLRLAYQAVSMVSNQYSPGVAARWFSNPCPALHYRSPRQVLAVDACDEDRSALIHAASRFLVEPSAATGRH